MMSPRYKVRHQYFSGDTSSWKRQMEKKEVGKSNMKLERMKLENSHQSWKVGAEVGKSPTSSFPTSVTTFKVQLNFPTLARIF